MTDETNKPTSLMPHAILGAAVIIVLLVVYFWLSPSQEEPQPVREPLPQPVVAEPVEPDPEPEPEPEPEPIVEPEVPEIVEPEPEPVDTSDAAVKTSLLNLSDYDAAGSLLVNEALLQRFVVLTENMSRGDTAPNHQVFHPPGQAFRVYTQAGKEWIDAASYKRYTPYVDTFEGMDTETLIDLYHLYKPTIAEIYAEIGDPDEDFDNVVKQAINHLLDTPEVPVPIEVYTDSVMYKYRDTRLEDLSGPQKHLLRTGPENMRRIKAKLREVLETL